MNTPTSSPVEETKKSTPPPTVKEQLLTIFLLLTIVPLVVWFFMSGEPSAPAQTVAEESKQKDDASKHYSYVLDFIKSQANHPSTVEFCSMFNKLIKTEPEPDGSRLHAYRNCMTAKNSFGLELEYDWVVVIHEKLDGTIEVVNWDIVEK